MIGNASPLMRGAVVRAVPCRGHQDAVREMQGRNVKPAGGLLFFAAENAAGLLFFPSNGLGEYAIHH